MRRQKWKVKSDGHKNWPEFYHELSKPKMRKIDHKIQTLDGDGLADLDPTLSKLSSLKSSYESAC
jgi:hypothetical protein